MSIADNANIPPEIDTDYLRSLFSQLDARHVEAFYKNYQQWQLEQQGTRLQQQIAAIDQQIADIGVLMHMTQPSAIALATLTRLQSYGVDDIDLLDSMLERGDTWLDHTLQLLEQCERLDVIHGNYTQWCRNALEDAYNWLDSIDSNEVSQPTPDHITQEEPDNDTTEVLLIQKLMSEEPVGIGLSRPSDVSGADEGRDESVPTETHIPIPSMLSYSSRIETATEEPTPSQEDIPAPVAPVHEIPSTDIQQKSPKHGFVSRILARVWQT